MARREATRVDGVLGGGTGTGDAGLESSTPWGVRLLRIIRNPYARLGAAVGAIAVPVLMIALSSPHSGWRAAGMLLGMLLAGLFMPPGWSRYRRRWWGGW